MWSPTYSTWTAASPEHAYYHADGNGNVTALVDASRNVVAKYLYDPFGNTMSATGSKAALNKYRFSSKEWHGPSGMVYYGYRWYVPELQRWPNSDPIAEMGFARLRYTKVRHIRMTSAKDGGPSSNAKYFQQRSQKPLYGFVFNNPVNRMDLVGLDSPGCDVVPPIAESACRLECCAEHDHCYRQNNCTAWSWLITWCPWSRCGRCNVVVIGCFAGCIGNTDDDPDKPNYYCGLHNVWFDDPNDKHMGHSTR